MEGLIWRIGNGNKVWIWKDKWLPQQNTFMIQSPPLLLDPNALDGELIDKEAKGWNMAKLEINSFFQRRNSADFVFTIKCS
jgi:hypothetical protein